MELFDVKEIEQDDSMIRSYERRLPTGWVCFSRLFSLGEEIRSIFLEVVEHYVFPFVQPIESSGQ